MPDPVGFCDIESTALDRDLLQVWEVALIVGETEHVWTLPVDLSRADPMSLAMNGFNDRYGYWDTPEKDWPTIRRTFARQFAALTAGLTLVGANPAFDERALWKLLRDNGECPLWHYRPICVETLAAGYLSATLRQTDLERLGPVLTVPWKHTGLVRALGINPDEFDRHSALGDARLCKAVWERVMGNDRS